MAEIPSTPYDGNVRAALVPTVADVNAPTAAELTSGIDISCYLTGDGLAITVDQQTISDERLCSTSTFEKRGRKTHSVDVTYVDNTNSVAHAAFNEAREALDEGAVHYLVTRRNLPYETAFEAAQVVRVYPVEAGFPAEVPGEANSVTRTTSKLFVTGDPGIDVAVAAGV
ncbi:hypothetical protein ACLQ8T_05815 [Glutamicibacter sp. FR1]|uniref:phage tail tube protein n=1 Tax=Glutamicibacter sp. FR1 TaxID=3393744 RepID=UPI0039B0897B